MFLLARAAGLRCGGATIVAPLCSGLARRPLKAVARVRIPSGLPAKAPRSSTWAFVVRGRSTGSNRSSVSSRLGRRPDLARPGDGDPARGPAAPAWTRCVVSGEVERLRGRLACRPSPRGLPRRLAPAPAAAGTGCRCRLARAGRACSVACCWCWSTSLSLAAAAHTICACSRPGLAAQPLDRPGDRHRRDDPAAGAAHRRRHRGDARLALADALRPAAAADRRERGRGELRLAQAAVQPVRLLPGQQDLGGRAGLHRQRRADRHGVAQPGEPLGARPRRPGCRPGGGRAGRSRR